jgi:hypothetical protein
MTTINARDKPTQPDSFVDVIHGATAVKPDVVMTMKADVSHAFWHGKVNLVAALASRQIVATGPIPKILKLLPAVAPLYKIYPELLRKKGYPNLVLSNAARSVTHAQEKRDRRAGHRRRRLLGCARRRPVADAHRPARARPR